MIIAQTLQTVLPNQKILTSPKNFNGELWFLVSLLDIQQFSPSVSSFWWLFVRAVQYWLFGKGKEYDVFVGEYGIDMVGEMKQLIDVVAPDIAIVTRIDAVHGMQMGGVEQIAEEKGLLVAHAKDIVYLNTDDYRVVAMAQRSLTDIFRYGSSSEATHSIDEVTYHREWSAVESHAVYYVGDKQYDIASTVYTDSEHYYVSVGLSIAWLLASRLHIDVSLPERLHYNLQPWRCRFLGWINDSMLLDSSYNAAPASMQMMLHFTGMISKELFSDKKLFLVLWEMRELGESTQKHHEALAVWIEEIQPDLILLVGNDTTYTYDLLKKEREVALFTSARLAGDYLRKYLESNSALVLFKWSQNTVYLEEAVKLVLQNNSDREFLGRQEEWWMKRKEEFFADNVSALE